MCDGTHKPEMRTEHGTLRRSAIKFPIQERVPPLDHVACGSAYVASLRSPEIYVRVVRNKGGIDRAVALILC